MFKMFLPLVLICMLCWISAFVILHSRTCCCCEKLIFSTRISAMDTSYPWYCKDCIKEVH